MLDNLLGIDVNLGLSYCMDDEDFYREVLEEYVNSDKSEELIKFFNEKDWYNYQIRIHGVKSTSLTIGAQSLSAKALALESACKEGREDYILASHEECLEHYRQILDTVRKALESD